MTNGLNTIENYKDCAKLPCLINLVEEFIKGDMSSFWVTIGEEETATTGLKLGWNSIIAYDTTGKNVVLDNLSKAALEIIEYAKTISGLDRITLNFLKPLSLMPIHIDGKPGPVKDIGLGEYDISGPHYNVIIPVNTAGRSIIDDKVISNEQGKAIVFDCQIPHGAMNDSLETRITIFLLINKEEFTCNEIS